MAAVHCFSHVMPSHTFLLFHQLFLWLECFCLSLHWWTPGQMPSVLWDPSLHVMFAIFPLCALSTLCIYLYDSISFIVLGLLVPSSSLVFWGLLHVFPFPVMDTDQVITFLFHRFVGLERYGTLDLSYNLFNQSCSSQQDFCHTAVGNVWKHVWELCIVIMTGGWLSLAFTGPGPGVLNLMQCMGQFCTRRDCSV